MLMSSASVFAVQQNEIESLFAMSLQELTNVTITTASRRPQNLSSTASSIQVITREEIRRSGATNLPEALRLASNLTVAQQNSHEWIISARGFSSDVGNKLLVLFDGRTVYTPLFSGVFWDRQDYLMEDIERIEVISGPGGTLWGANAVNGVINIITRSSSESKGVLVEGASGTQLNSLVGLRIGNDLSESTQYRMYGKYKDHDPGTLTDGSRGRDAWDMAQVGFRIDSEINTQHRLMLQADHYQNEAQVYSGGESKTLGSNILGRWVYTPDRRSESQLQVYLDRTELELPVAETVINAIFLAPEGVFRDTLEIADVDFQYRYTSENSHSIIGGVGYRYTHDDNENAPGLGFLPDELEQDLYSAFLQGDLSIIENTLTFTIGTKLENNDYTGEEWEPSARLAWAINGDHFLWGAISKAVRMPSRIDREIRQPSSPNFVILSGNDDFESEEMNIYEIGYKGQPSKDMSLTVSLFYNEIDNLRSTNLDPVTVFPLFFENNLEGKAQGIEINSKFQVKKWWRFTVGYTYLDTDIDVKDGEFDFNNALNENSDPNNQLTIQSYMNVGKRWEFDIFYRWVDKLPTNNAGVRTYVSQYDELGVHIGWFPSQNLEFSLVGQNLLNDHHQEFGIPGSTQEEVGRNLTLAIKWRLQ